MLHSLDKDSIIQMIYSLLEFVADESPSSLKSSLDTRSTDGDLGALPFDQLVGLAERLMKRLMCSSPSQS